MCREMRNPSGKTEVLHLPARIFMQRRKIPGVQFYTPGKIREMYCGII